MRIAEHKQIRTKTEKEIVYRPAQYDESGNVIAEAYEEEIEVEVPVYDTVYRDMTPEEEAEYIRLSQPSKEMQIEELKQQLSDTDYKAIKYAEGWISEEEYAPIKAERQAIRDRINEIENEVE